MRIFCWRFQMSQVEQGNNFPRSKSSDYYIKKTKGLCHPGAINVTEYWPLPDGIPNAFYNWSQWSMWGGRLIQVFVPNIYFRRSINSGDLRPYIYRRYLMKKITMERPANTGGLRRSKAFEANDNFWTVSHYCPFFPFPGNDWYFS